MTDDEINALVEGITRLIPDPNPILAAMTAILKEEDLCFINLSKDDVTYLIVVNKSQNIIGAMELHEDSCTIKMGGTIRRFILGDPSFDPMLIVEEIRSKARSLRGEE
jgi:hypothetical protein